MESPSADPPKMDSPTVDPSNTDSPPDDPPKMDTPVKTKSAEEAPGGPASRQPESPTSEASKNAKSVYEFTVVDKDGQDVSLEKYRGKVLLIVNIASKCGYTPSNNKELTELKEKYESKGECSQLVVFNDQLDFAFLPIFFVLNFNLHH